MRKGHNNINMNMSQIHLIGQVARLFLNISVKSNKRGQENITDTPHIIGL